MTLRRAFHAVSQQHEHLLEGRRHDFVAIDD